MTLFYILVGLMGLWVGAKWIIDGALGFAALFRLSQTFVGIAILAVGTDLPELLVTLKASLMALDGQDTSGIVTGNALGSCFSQITLILGAAALFLPLSLSKATLFYHGAGLIGGLIALFVFGFDGRVDRWEGVFLMLGYVLYYNYLTKTSREAETTIPVHTAGQVSIGRASGLLALGFVVLIFSAHMVVEYTLILAETYGLTQSFAGIVLIGIGTSLPELAVSISAAWNRAAGLSVGNIIGSNIFDGLVPIGLGSAIHPLVFESELYMQDLPMLLLVSCLVLWWLYAGLARNGGILLLLLFAAYMAFKFYTL